MFSKELENLIKATLEDGKLTDLEKKALVKRAQNEGVDLDELEIYIDSILQKRERELKLQREAEYAAHDKAKMEEFGKVCPSCKRQVKSMTLQCECGYEFINHGTVSAAQILSDKINEIQNAPYKSSVGSDDYDTEVQAREQKIRDVITFAVIPNSKEDIIEFLALSAPNSRHKGNMFGTVMGRFVIFSSITLILNIVYYIIAATLDSYSDRESMYIAGFSLTIASIFGTILLIFKMDKETLRWNKNAKVWRAKFEQTIIKARSLRGDAEFSKRVDYYENIVYGEKGLANHVEHWWN